MKKLHLHETPLESNQIEYFLGNFLDSFQKHPSREAFLLEPPLLKAKFSKGIIWDAYWAGVAEHLCYQEGFLTPPWIHHPNRFLKTPFFASEASSLRATLLLESPISFRRRNIFITANALHRI